MISALSIPGRRKQHNKCINSSFLLCYYYTEILLARRNFILFESLDKIKRNAILTTILCIALGVIILLTPTNLNPVMIPGFGYMLVVIAIVMMLDFFQAARR